MHKAGALCLLVLIAGCSQPTSQLATPHVLTHAEALLFSELFPKVIVEIDYVSGYRPSQHALEGLEAQLRNVGGKADVLFLPPSEIPPQGSFVSAARADQIAAQTANAVRPGVFANENAALLHILYLEGEYEGPAMGIYSRKTGAILLFTRYLDSSSVGPASVENSGLALDREKRELYILGHEAGHAFGLVNCGIPMVRDHQHVGDYCHSSNAESIMTAHPKLGTKPSEIVGYGTGPYNRGFDEYDLEDVRAFKATAPSTIWKDWV